MSHVPLHYLMMFCADMCRRTFFTRTNERVLVCSFYLFCSATLTHRLLWIVDPFTWNLNCSHHEIPLSMVRHLCPQYADNRSFTGVRGPKPQGDDERRAHRRRGTAFFLTPATNHLSVFYWVRFAADPDRPTFPLSVVCYPSYYWCVCQSFGWNKNKMFVNKFK